MTHVGLICDCKRLQRLLPQFFLANTHLIPQRELAILRGSMPPFTHLMQCKSSWNDVCKMVQIIAAIGSALQTHAPGALTILSMDASRVHLSAVVLREFDRWGIRVVIIPPKLTWLLQPLDTHVFASMKRAVRDAYQTRLGANGGLALSMRDWVGVVCHTVYRFLAPRDWARAFDHNGFGSKQQLVSRRVLTGLELTAIPEVSSTEPTRSQLASLWPRGARVEAALVPRRPFILRIRMTPRFRARMAARAAGSDTATPVVGVAAG